MGYTYKQSIGKQRKSPPPSQPRVKLRFDPGHEEALLRALLDSFDYGVLMSNPAREDIVCNQRFSEIFGLDSELVMRSSPDEVRAMVRDKLENPEAFVRLLDEVYADPMTVRHDELRLKGDPPITLRRYTGPVFSAEGKHLGRIWTFLDVTTEKRLSDEVKSYADQLSQQLQKEHQDLAITSEVLSAMNRISRAANETLEISQLLERIAVIVCPLLGHNSCAMLLKDPNAPQLYGALVNARAKNAVEKTFSLDQEPMLEDWFNLKSELPPLALLNDPQTPIAKALDCRSMGVAPLCLKQRLRGVLVLGARHKQFALDQRGMAQLEAIINQAALALETRFLQEELLQAQKQLVQSEKLSAVGALSAGIAQDIRNIMTALSLDMSAAEHPDELTNTVQLQMDRFMALAHRLLSYAQPHAIAYAPVNIDVLLKHVLDLVEAQAEIESVKIESDFNTGKAPVIGDENQLAHLFVNLAINALGAMSVKGGVLKVTTRPASGGVEIEVSDTGNGIALEHLPRVFEPFSTTRSNGYGLGLYSCKRIVNDHSGKISVASEPGRGAKFTVWLPSAKRNKK